MKKTSLVLILTGLAAFLGSSGYAANLDDDFNDGVLSEQFFYPGGTNGLTEHDGVFDLAYPGSGEAYAYSNCYAEDPYDWATADHCLMRIWAKDMPDWAGLYQSWVGPSERSDFLISADNVKATFYSRGVASSAWDIGTVYFPSSWNGSNQDTYWEIEFGQDAAGTEKKVSFRAWKPSNFSETWLPEGIAPDICWDDTYEPGTSEVMIKISQGGYGNRLGSFDRIQVELIPGAQLFPGDANGDGMVDVGDLGILAGNYGTASGATWAMGDFNGDGAVDVGDLGILAGNYGSSSVTSVPEPMSLGLLGMGFFALLRRKS